MSETTPSTPPPTPTEQNLTPEQRRVVAIVGVLTLAVVAGLIIAVYFMVQYPAATTVIRDIFIIFMALESLFIGVALIILMIQLARLTNLLQHEIKPILQNTNETVNTVRGTAVFISENLVDPVMKLNGYIAAIGKFFELINVVTKK
ncbi:MAG TPA: hypothetical protein VI547_07750 [Anaerolineales bacterium]|nr:hypothetical protein [Anaerolineales bacterium]HLF01857.1 hypothetical protein [Anaerolineales bacterium]